MVLGVLRRTFQHQLGIRAGKCTVNLVQYILAVVPCAEVPLNRNSTASATVYVYTWVCVRVRVRARACVRACVNDWVWVWGYPKNPYSVCVFEVPEHGTRRRLSCCVCLCAGVFAVILQQLDCSLGYVYVSHLSVPLLFFPTYVSVPCLLSNQLYCCTGTVSVVNICHNSCLYCYTVQTLNTRFLRLHAGPASIWRLPSWFSRGVGSSFPLSCFVHCC